MNGQHRNDIKKGSKVYIVLKKDQRTGKRTSGTVKDILKRSSYHPHGIKVRMEDGRVGRAQEIINNLVYYMGEIASPPLRIITNLKIRR